MKLDHNYINLPLIGTGYACVIKRNEYYCVSPPNTSQVNKLNKSTTEESMVMFKNVLQMHLCKIIISECI